MLYKVGYLIPANEDIYSVVRQCLPAQCELFTLQDAPLAELDVIIAGKVSRTMMESAPKLKMILTPGIGSDGIDVAAATALNIPVAVTQSGNTTEVAEFTLLLMLAVSQRLVELDTALRAGKWMAWDRRIHSSNLAGRTLGLIGFGRIGQAVAKRAEAFSMNLQHHDLLSGGVSLDTLLTTSDYVSLHIPLTPSTRHLLNASRIALMKQGAVLINTARGEVVDEPALIDALRAGRIAGAGLDVFEKEPLDASSPLLSMPNVVLTPHVASGTLDGLKLKTARYAENISRLLAGESLIDAIT